jgi:Phage tail lysozyme
MTLLDIGWTEEQAKGLLDSLKLNGSTPNWKSEHLQKLRDWCSAHGKDSATVDAQLEFIAYELLNSYQGIGSFLKRAETVEEAREAVAPYVRRLSAQ